MKQQKSSETVLSSVLNAVPVLIAYVDKELRYQYMNESYQRWFNIDPSDYIGKTMLSLIGSAAFDTLKSYAELVLQGNDVSFETEIKYLNGVRYINGIYTPDFDTDKNVKGFTVLISDITSKKKAEQTDIRNNEMLAVKKNEARYLKMLDEVQDYAIIFLSPHGVIETWNKGAEKIKGYSTSEVIGKHFSVFYTPEDNHMGLPQELLNEAAKKGKVIHEGWRLRKDGSKFWGSVVITTLYEDSKVIGFSKVTRDLTEKKLAEDKIREYTHQLEIQNKELDQFAYVASHDLQEPIRKIKIFNERILESTKLPEEVLGYFQRSISAADRMQRLISDLLAYSRTTVESQAFVPIDLNMVVQDVIKSRKEIIDEADMEIDVAPLPTIDGIAFQIAQLFDNLISNAIKYRDHDRKHVIRISCRSISGELLPAVADEQKKYWEITIKDNGMGFEPEFSEKIFEIFQRLHSHTKLPGSGIGLAICKRVMTNHKGFISAEGKTNVGATFRLYFPQ